MNSDRIAELLNKTYKIELHGGHIAFILMLLAQRQRELAATARNNITDIDATVAAATNEVVGNDFLHAVYEAAGPDLLSFAMNTDNATVKIFMESRDLDEIDRAAKTMGVYTSRDLN